MSDTLNLIPTLNPHYRFQWEEAQNCYVLLYPEGMIKFNGSAGEILAQVDGTRTIGDIIKTLNAKFPGIDGLENDVVEFFHDAFAKRWLQHQDLGAE
ncbi:MAG TPA: pyrroloquinoline quinone biosynthesis peptide chaperone PqqD [Cellvibrionaceae bacterium]|nr:pyrroloquinoline quinone biosynthesis peptide chaperone PqqD [Cellvibrionaceae bacterium]HMY40745.1 pyrroloquinoline quinone biosynthesis peptide chaperone PqqD [Marinagarivorans sp.]HNG58297.1 pyrroloquinoline quinone biosynthesis peptide chaperone PqqD [Cellvibrionaceae bacterium]